MDFSDCYFHQDDRLYSLNVTRFNSWYEIPYFLVLNLFSVWYILMFSVNLLLILSIFLFLDIEKKKSELGSVLRILGLFWWKAS